MIEYRKGSVFDHLEPNMIIVHSVNGQGVWGAGFAKELKERYPEAYEKYKAFCGIKPWPLLRGKDIICGDYKSDQFISCLFVSQRYGQEKDTPREIIATTISALGNLLHCAEDITFISPKINSGLFEVPWIKTEGIINSCLEAFSDQNIKWIVCDPNLKETP